MFVEEPAKGKEERRGIIYAIPTCLLAQPRNLFESWAKVFSPRWFSFCSGILRSVGLTCARTIEPSKQVSKSNCYHRLKFSMSFALPLLSKLFIKFSLLPYLIYCTKSNVPFCSSKNKSNFFFRVKNPKNEKSWNCSLFSIISWFFFWILVFAIEKKK